MWARGARQKLLFFAPTDYSVYLARLGQTTRKFGWLVHAYCLIPNHLHLLIETPHGNLSDGMKWFHETYARDFNKAHGYVGHAFQSRFGSKPVQDPYHEDTVFWYIAMNAVEAGLSERPAEYPWSSFGAAVGTFPPESFVTHRLAHRVLARCPHPVGDMRTLQELLKDDSSASICAARAEGYLIRDIADHLGISISTVHKRLRANTGV